MARRRRNDADGALSFVVMIILCIIAMPIAGLVMICNKNPKTTVWGWILLILGIILWIAVFA